MSISNGASPDIEFLMGVNSQNDSIGQGSHSKGFIKLIIINLICLETRVSKQRLDGFWNGNGEINWWKGTVCNTNDSGQWLDIVFLQASFRHKDQSNTRIIDLWRRNSCETTIFLESCFQSRHFFSFEFRVFLIFKDLEKKRMNFAENLKLVLFLSRWSWLVRWSASISHPCWPWWCVRSLAQPTYRTFLWWSWSPWRSFQRLLPSISQHWGQSNRLEGGRWQQCGRIQLPFSTKKIKTF